MLPLYVKFCVLSLNAHIFFLGIHRYAAEGSLLDTKAIVDSVAAAITGSQQPLVFVGCKITALHCGRYVGSDIDDTQTRVGLNRDLLKQICAAITTVDGSFLSTHS